MSADVLHMPMSAIYMYGRTQWLLLLHEIWAAVQFVRHSLGQGTRAKDWALFFKKRKKYSCIYLKNQPLTPRDQSQALGPGPTECCPYWVILGVGIHKTEAWRNAPRKDVKTKQDQNQQWDISGTIWTIWIEIWLTWQFIDKIFWWGVLKSWTNMARQPKQVNIENYLSGKFE